MSRVGFLRKCLVLMLVVLFLSSAIAASAKAPEYKWRFGQTSVRASQGESYKLFCELIEKYSDGRIQVEFFLTTSLVL